MIPRHFTLARIGAFIGLLCCLLTSAYAQVQQRPLPTDAKVGELSAAPNKVLLIDDKPRTLTAGAQIRNYQNLIIQPQTLLTELATKYAGLVVLVLYTENNQGQIQRMWILSRDEAEAYAQDKSKN
jgi:hypothetical protein